MNRWQLAKAIYEGRMKKAWGRHDYKSQFPDIDDPVAMREYPHKAVAEVDLALASADAVITLMGEKPAGFGWKLSPEAKKDIEEIERHAIWGPKL